MSLRASVRAMFLVLCVGQLWAGCNSLDEDTPDRLDFALPTVSWTISTDDPQWRASPPRDAATPGFVCAGPEVLPGADCCAPPLDCQEYPFACDPNSNFCALTFDVDLAETVLLAEQVQALAAARGRAFARVELLALATNVDKPDGLPIRAASLFIGPEDLATSSDPSAVLLASVALVKGSFAAPLEGAGARAFAGFAQEYQTPFSLLLSAHVVVPNGAVVPSGMVQVTATGQARGYY